MRINKFVAQATGMSRRAADRVIEEKRVMLNDRLATLGDTVQDQDIVRLDSHILTANETITTIMLNKPAGYVVSREGQGSATIYELLPREYHHLKPVGRLDKDSSGLLLLTNDGQLAHDLTHPSKHKLKIYEVHLKTPLTREHQQQITSQGIELEDGLSKLGLTELQDAQSWRVTMHEGRNRQIRRTFTALGYTVTRLHRTHFGPYQLNNLRRAHWRNA